MQRNLPALLLAVTAGGAPALGAPEDDFEISLVASGLDHPVALAVAPDGVIFVTEKSGKVRLIDANGLQQAPFAQLEVHVGGENGLLGIDVDPAYETNRYVYVFASVAREEQRIIRYRNQDGVGVNPVIIRDNLPSTGDVHSGGCLKFGPDGMLYFSIGDNGNRDNAQSLTTLSGKICRVESDGDIPDSNPFKTPTGSPRAIWALGFRNPFRFCFAPDGRMFVMDVGSDGDQRREEINIVRKGDNGAWPLVEGYSPIGVLPPFIDPIVAYHDEGAAVTAGVVYSGRQFPPEYRGDLFHLEYVLNRLYKMELDGDRMVSQEVFLQLGGGVVDLIQDRDGSLLYTELYTGSVKRIAYIGAPFEQPDDNSNDNGNDNAASDDDGGDAGDPDDGPGDDGGNDNASNDNGAPSANDNAADDANGNSADDDDQNSSGLPCGTAALLPAALTAAAVGLRRRR